MENENPVEVTQEPAPSPLEAKLPEPVSDGRLADDIAWHLDETLKLMTEAKSRGIAVNFSVLVNEAGNYESKLNIQRIIILKSIV